MELEPLFASLWKEFTVTPYDGGLMLTCPVCNQVAYAEDALVGYVAELADDHARTHERCKHESSTGVDASPFGDRKVWSCDMCGWRYRSIRRADGTDVMESADA